MYLTFIIFFNKILEWQVDIENTCQDILERTRLANQIAAP